MAKCVMIAEANTDAPKSFCDAPDRTGHRDMARCAEAHGAVSQQEEPAVLPAEVRRHLLR